MGKFFTIFRIPELRMKIFFTLLLLAIYRLGYLIPLPFVDQAGFKAWAERVHGSEVGQALGSLSMLGGTTLSQSTIFGLGIMPYISASIIFQLLASVVPALEKLQKEGEVGRKKINEYTRYATVVICLLQSAFLVNVLWSQEGAAGVGNDQARPAVIAEEYRASGAWFYATVSVIVMTAGTMFLMWIGEQIDEYGIGNGISLIIMAGIIGRLPDAFRLLYKKFTPSLSADPGQIGVVHLAQLLVLFIAVIVGVVIITQAQRRIQIQSAKHVRGRRVMGGNRQYLPLRVNQSGVMPIIFAGSLLLIPSMVFSFLSKSINWYPFHLLYDSFSHHGFLYNLSYIALIYFFCYFWTAITFNPKDMANNLKDYGSFIPGYRPGKRTAEYLERVMLRITYVGAAFLAAVAIIPTLVSDFMGVEYRIAAFFGGTSLLIMISVALDLIAKIDNHLIMRNYASLVETRK
jgi:preprotein translocase subunit SecY